MDWKDGLTAAAIIGVGLFGVKTIRDTQYRNYLVNKFGDRNAETFEARGTWNLYKSQEKVLKAYRDSGGNANDYDSLPTDIVNKLESIRNSETLWSDVNRWLWDNPSKNKNPYGFHSMWDAESFAAEKPTVFAMLEYLKYNPSNGVKGIEALPPGEYRVKRGEASKSKLYYGRELKELKEGDVISFVAIDRLHYDTNVAFDVPIYEYENNKIEYYDYDLRPTKRGQGRTKDAYFNNALFDSKTSELPLRDIPLDWVRIRGIWDASFLQSIYGHKFMQGFRKWISNAQNKKMVNDEYNRRFGKKLNAESFAADNFGDMEYILLSMLTPAQVEDEYGDYMKEKGIGIKDLPQALEDDYRTNDEAEYLREKYFEEEGEACAYCDDTEEEGKEDSDGDFICNPCWEKYPEEHQAESFSADSISICGVCSVAGHRHCGQTTGCPCCEIRVKKESQRPTCGDCGELKSSTPQEYNQWTCWPCTNAVDWHGNNCYCQTCMAETDESFSADSKTESCSCGMDNCSNHTEWMPCAECGIRSKGVSLNINTCDPCSEMVWMQKNIDEIRTKIKENYRFQKEHDKEFPFYETRLGAESYSAESMCKYCKINDPENCMYFGPTCLDAESHAYSYAYNEGHSDSRKKEEYRPNLTSARQEGDFKKILKQKGD